jgi:hypothetical protein
MGAADGVIPSHITRPHLTLFWSDFKQYNSGSTMSEFKCDKLERQYMLRIPEVLEANLKTLTPTQKKKMHEDIMRLMARACHESVFDYKIYTSSE